MDASDKIRENEMKNKLEKLSKTNMEERIKHEEFSGYKDHEDWNPESYLRNLEERISRKKDFSEYQTQQKVITLKNHSLMVKKQTYKYIF